MTVEPASLNQPLDDKSRVVFPLPQEVDGDRLRLGDADVITENASQGKLRVFPTQHDRGLQHSAPKIIYFNTRTDPLAGEDFDRREGQSGVTNYTGALLSTFSE